MAQPNFWHVTPPPIQPLLLVRDADLQSGLAMLQDIGREIGHEITTPKRSEIALRGKAVLGIGLTDPLRLKDALQGKYATEVWGDLRADLGEVYGKELIEMLFGDPVGQEGATLQKSKEVHLQVFALLANEGQGVLSRGLRFLWRAWNLRFQVVGQRRPLSLWPAVGGDVLGDVTTFTPILTYVGTNKWRIGYPGDARRDSPLEYEAADPGEALEKAWPVFSFWYNEEQDAIGGSLRERAREQHLRPPNLDFEGLVHRLRQHDFLEIGECRLDNVSHGSVYSLSTPRRGTVILRADRPTAVAALLLAAAGYGAEKPTILPSEAERAYTFMMTGDEERTWQEAEVDSRLRVTQARAWQIEVEPQTTLLVTVLNAPSAKNVAGTLVATGPTGEERALLVADGTNINLVNQQKVTLAQVNVHGSWEAWQAALAAWAGYQWLQEKG